MWINYCLSAWRNLIKNGMFSAINIFGLALGLMSCILIMLFVQDELGYEKNLPESEKIVRLHTSYTPAGRVPFHTIRSAGRMMEAIKSYANAQVAEGTRLLSVGFTAQVDGEAFNETVTYADGSFFSLFDFPFIAGSKAEAFNNKNDMVLTKEMAIKYFGRTDVVGETLTFNSPMTPPLPYKITGVLDALPTNTHLNFTFLIHLDPALFDPFPNMLNTWSSVNTYTYFKLKEGAEIEELQSRISQFINTESVFKDQVAQMSAEAKATDFVQHKLMPIQDIYLNARTQAGSIGDMKALGDKTLVYTFMTVAILVLLIACINFMNLATARATGRAREVALRKVMGASRTQVALQFLGEAVLVSFIALLFAIAAVELILPSYNEILSRDLALDFTATPLALPMLLGTSLVVGLVAGSYPALYLSGFLPARILKANKSAETKGSSRFRFALVLFQFAISIGLVVSTAVVYGQTFYVLSKNPGYEVGQKLVVSGRNLPDEQKEMMRTALSKVDGVTSVSWASEVPTQDNENNTGFTLIDSDGRTVEGQQSVVINYHTMGVGFFESYDVTPLAGRLFSDDYGTDRIVALPEGATEMGRSTILLNESAVKALGLPSIEAAIGRRVRANVFRAGNYELEIVGVIPDLYYRSMKYGVRPSVYMQNPAAFRSMTVSYARQDVTNLVEELSSIWRERAPLQPLVIQHLDEMMASQYAAETAQGKIFAAFALLAIVIACLGLYGLASYTAERRTKEIGIRKVLGAGLIDIISLLVWQFSKPVMLGGLIAAPIAFHFMNEWLMAFEYRLGQEFVVLMVAIASVVALLVSWVTVASRAYKVASQNPINALRYE
ncbi:ABC transporter permease [Temperatibacter marinus]|uniref:ABC transporter permease n=1 Tax=Temperatibacter marinus TaxID=1456591 RepID=A0AA52EF39_9PROT|nr:ABC transporter permease [Temperatibacter marinus]WND01660.1 ABC transporter permease [Temperatibacter marinus]